VVSIVGQDEVNLDRNHISWASPLGRALMRAAEDDEVALHAPGGTEILTVLEVRYERIVVDRSANHLSTKARQRDSIADVSEARAHGRETVYSEKRCCRKWLRTTSSTSAQSQNALAGHE
jgi:transcription elongation factor GreB